MGGKHATSSSTVSIPPEVLARYNAVNARAETAASKPFQSYGTQASDYVAPVNAQETMGMNTINASTGPASAGIDRYMSPYIKNVADTTGAMLKQQYEQGQSGALGTAASSGAFGGDRAGIAAANLQQQNQMGYGKTMADIMNQGYTQALGASQADLARGLQGGQMQMAAGAVQQQTEQAGKDAMIKQFMQQQGYPFQTAQFLANIAMGTGALSGTTTTSTQPLDMWGNPYASGGVVKQNDSLMGDGLWARGYVPAGDLPVNGLVPAGTPSGSGKDGSGSGNGLLNFVKAIMGKAYGGGVAGDRHGYATDGFVDPFGIPPQDASPAWSSEDEAKHRAVIAAAEAALHPTAPTGVVAPISKSGLGNADLSPHDAPLQEFPFNGQMWTQGRQGQITDQYGESPEMSMLSPMLRAKNEFYSNQRRSPESMLLQGETADINSDFENAKINAELKNRLSGMYGMDQGAQPTQLLYRKENLGSMPAAPLQHPVSPSGDFWAKMGASDSAIANAARGVAGPSAAVQPTATLTAQSVAGPAPSTVTPDHQGVAGPTPAVQAPSTIKPADQKASADPFGYALSFVFKSEGGLNPRDANGTPSMYGVNQAAHPEVDVTKLTRQQASEIYRHDYWNPINGDALAEKDPQLARAVFDTAVMSGVGEAKKLLSQSGGDTQKFLQLRANFLDGLLRDNPEKYGQYAAAWNTRTLALGGPNMMNNNGEGGLGSADMSNQKPYGERNAIGQFFHNQNGTMSQPGISAFLEGLAGMTTGHTVASSLLRGLGAGANAYQAAQTQQADLSEKNISNLNNLWTNYQNYIQSPNAQNVPFSQYAQSAGYNGPIPDTMQGPTANSTTGPGGQYNVSAFTDTSTLGTLSNGTQVIHANDPGWLTNFITANQSYTQPNVVRAVEAARQKLADLYNTGYTTAADGSRTILPDQERLAAQQGLQAVKVKTLSDMGENASAIGSTYPQQKQVIDSIVSHLSETNTGPVGSTTSFIQNLAQELGLPAGNTDYTGFVNSQLQNLLSGTTGSGLSSVDPQIVRQILGGNGVNIGTNKNTVISQLGAVEGLIEYNKDFSDYFNKIQSDPNVSNVIKSDPNQIRSEFQKDHDVQAYVKKYTADVASKANLAPGVGDLAVSENVGPKIGEIQDGYKYLGGNPSNPSSWQKVK